MVNTAKLKGILREKNLTQKELANAMNISVASLNGKLSGKRNFTFEQGEKIISFLKLNDEDVRNIFFA